MELLTERNTIAIDFWGEFDRSSERKGLKDANFECARGNKTHRDITAPNIEKRRYNRIEICGCNLKFRILLLYKLATILFQHVQEGISKETLIYLIDKCAGLQSLTDR